MIISGSYYLYYRYFQMARISIGSLLWSTLRCTMASICIAVGFSYTSGSVLQLPHQEMVVVVLTTTYLMTEQVRNLQLLYSVAIITHR